MASSKPFTHIMAPIDGSACSINAGRLAIEIASELQARITFVYVVDATAVKEIARSSHRSIEQVQQEMKANGGRYLRHLTRQARRQELEVEQAIHFGTPYIEISEVARGGQVDLIVMGQVGKHGLRRLMMGSVTERVIELASCPVLVVKPE
ncbi:MAG: universal stress protein [Chloroflexota bacterium]|nr:universal stress protein [Chloroflexota bacterium]